MRSRRSANDHVAEVARRRLELLSAELAEIRPDPAEVPSPADQDGSGEPSSPGPTADPVTTADPVPPADSLPGRHRQRSVGPARSLTGWLEDRLPATLQGRVRLTASHLAVVGLLVVGGVAVTLWWVLRADRGESVVPPLAAPVSAAPLSGGPGQTPTEPPSAGSSATGPPGSAPATGAATGAAPAPSAAATGRIVVDVAGKVRRPGIATLPAGSRVVDALAAAGGPRRGVRTGSLNLARVLTDGEQIVVGLPAPSGVAASAASAPTSGAGTPLVNINTATESELEELPGVGPVTAQSILEFRAENGTFSAVDELLEISGIGDATLAKIAPYVTL
ncbi:MAG: competence protein ComEA [Nocardioidaceae bacterium]|nr:competence protein ComEA [Nocardioidaceae bacterium]